jgi:heterodisulfide reductase subunit B
MEKLKSNICLYPGCSLDGSATAFQSSLKCIFQKLDVECGTLREWNCCGATSAHALDHRLSLALNLRNLAVIEEQGYDQVLAPCAACYHRLAQTQFELDENPDLLDRMNSETDLNYRGSVTVRNALDFLANYVGTERIAAHVSQPMSGLRAVCYYGCLNTRVPRMDSFDDREYPMSMDGIVTALGAEAVDWSYKTECCGASLFVTNEPVQAKLVSKILRDAVARRADCIVVACPMCQNNLDTKQQAVQAQFDIGGSMPILYFTQLMGLAFGIKEAELQLHHNFVPFEAAKH